MMFLGDLRFEMDIEKSKAEKYPYMCYLLNGILYVPDYDIDAWVGPGSDNIYTKEMMESMGAKPKIEALWKRLKHTYL